MIHKGFILFIQAILPVLLTASTYYIAENGDNTNDGTAPGSAFATIQYASDLVQPGDSVIVLSGSYLGFNVATSGTSANPIVFLADGVVQIIAPTFTNDGINVEAADWIEINGFIVNNQPRNGIRLVIADFCIVRNCQCDNNFERGIFTGFTDDILIENNICSNSIDEHGIYVSNSSDRSVIRYNTCFGNNASGIQINADASEGGDGVSSDPEIYGNVLYNNGVSGGSAINLDGVQGAFIYNNLLYDNHATGIALFQIDGGVPSVNAVIVHNTIINASDGRWCILLVDGAVGAQIHNNILINQHPWRGSIAVDPDATTGLVSDYNMVVNSLSNQGDGVAMTLSEWQLFGYDQHSFIAAPMTSIFLNPGSSDFHLLPASPAVDAGNMSLAAGVVVDIEGNMRPFGPESDLGAYEETSVVLALDSADRDQPSDHSRIARYTVNSGHGGLVITGPLEGTTIRIYGLTGQLYQETRPYRVTQDFVSYQLPPGIYVVCVMRGGTIVFTSLATHF